MSHGFQHFNLVVSALNINPRGYQGAEFKIIIIILNTHTENAAEAAFMSSRTRRKPGRRGFTGLGGSGIGQN
jgi:hypothetical protein